MDFFDYLFAGLALVMFALGIASLAGFFITGMWHCLFCSAMPFGMVGVWYYEDYYSKNIPIKALWQRKNTKR